MLEFKKIAITDKERYDHYRKLDPTNGSEGAFATMFIWDEYYNLEVAENGEFLFIRFNIAGKKPSYFFPIGNGDLKKSVDELKEYSYSRNEKVEFRLVSSENKEKLEALFPSEFSYELDRDCSDYVYSTEKMISLAGKKLHSKKNHLNYFLQNYAYVYKSVDTEELVNQCANKAFELIEKKEKNKNPYEMGAMKSYFKNFHFLSQKGAVLIVDDKIVAMTFGEKLNDEMALIQIELADDSYRGAYQAINKMFCETEWKLLPYVNREEDMGIDGLRKAKLSYQPVMMIDKYKIKEN